jgi:hypothetical protein
MTRKSAAEVGSGRQSVPELHRRNPDPVMIYTGGRLVGVPHRDLYIGDLFRLARLRLLKESNGNRVGEPTTDQLEQLATEISSSGVFARQAPAQASTPKEVPAEPVTPTVTEEPAAPAEQE